MDFRFSPTPKDTERTAEILLYAVGVPIPDVVGGTAATLDLSPFVTRASQSQSDLSVTLAWHLELYGTAQPKPGQVIAAKLDGILLWVGIIESISDYRVESGTRTMTLACRSRDSTPAWRNVSRVTNEYPQGTRLDVIARDVALSLGLQDGEILLPASSMATPHSTAQLAAVPAWSMLETLLLPSGAGPMVDGLGRLKAVSHDCTRASDVVLTEDRIVAVTGSRSKPPLTVLRLKWLDPSFTRVEQQDQVLAQANITAGYFQIKQEQDVLFSGDQTQRAVDTHLVIRQSANSGILPVCSEGYAALSETVGRITLRTAAWVPALLSVMLASKLAAALPDGVTGGSTISIGRKVQAALEFSVMLTMASIGTGSYEVWGTPFDYVKGRNITEAYDPEFEDQEWSANPAEIESDFISSEDHAQAVTGIEFIYRALGVNSYSATLVDDPRIEVGDILELPDASRIYVTGYKRELTRGASALIDVEGFRV